MYFPTGSDISFELEVSDARGRTSEIVRAFSPAVSRPQLAGLSGLPVPLPLSPPLSDAEIERLARPPRKAMAHRSAPEKARRFVPLPSKPPASEALLPAPPRVAAVPVSSPLTGPLGRRSQKEATVTLGPARPVSSPLRRIPALLRLQRQPDTPGKGFVPPRPVKQVKPVIPASLASGGAITLELKVKLDESGDVITTEVLHDNAPAPVSHSIQAAAREWRFAPALINGKAVPSQTTMRFRFEP